MTRLAYLPLVVAACTMSGDDRPKTVQYAAEAVFAPNCAGAACHSSFGNNDNYTFDTVDGVRHAMQSLVELDSAGDARGHAIGAALITWITVQNPFDLNIGRMPYDRPMADADVEYLKDWIDAGLLGAQCNPMLARACDHATISTCNSSWNFATGLGTCGPMPGNLPNTSSGICQSGKCECDPGFGDCNDDSQAGTTPDGCEQKLDLDGNCGGCGIQCSDPMKPPTGHICRATVGKDMNGKPALSGVFSCQCAVGTLECDGDPATLCETAINTNTDCGACGTACTSPKTCQAVAGVPGAFSCQ